MSEGGVFLDVFARMNLASIDRVLRDVKTAMREGGVSAGRDFSEGLTAGLRDVSRVADLAFRDMQDGLGRLQVAEAQINNLRAQNFKRSTDAMIAAQRELDAAITNTQKLMEGSTAAAADRRAAIAAAPRGGGGEDRGRGLGRTGNIIGGGATIAAAGGLFEAGRIAVDVQGKLNQVIAQQHDSAENQRLLTQSVWQIAQQSGIKPREISSQYGQVERATNYVTGEGYRGQDAVDVMRNATMLTRTAPGTSLEEAIQAITTTSHDYRIKVEDAAALLSAGAANVKGGMDDFANSLHSIEPIAQQAGIKPQEIIAALEQASQTGQTSQQSSPNLANLIKGLARPAATQSKALGQLGIDPEDLSTHLSERGLAGTLSIIQQAILKKQGPDGNVNLGYAYQNQLESQYQEQDFEKLSPQIQALLRTPKFQNSEVGGTSKQLAKVFGDAGVEVSPEDVPIVSDWLKKQKELHGPSSNIRTEKPEIQDILGAYSAAFGGQDAGRMGMMLAGSPQLLQQYQGREADLGQQGTPNVFMDTFNQAMSSDQVKFEKLGASAEALAGKMGEHMLPILGRVADDLNGFIDFLDRNKVAMDAFIVAVGGAAAAFLATKLHLPQAGKWAWDTFKPNYQGGYGRPSPVGGAAGGGAGSAEGVVSGAREGAPILGEGVVLGAKEGATLFTGGVSAGAKGAAAQLTAGVAAGGKDAGETIASAMVGAGKEAGAEIAAEMDSGAGALGGKLAGAMGPALAGVLGAQLADSVADRFDKSHKSSIGNALTNNPLTAFGPWLWRQGSNFLDNKPVTATIPGLGEVGKARGGIVGYRGGTDKVADPFSQPLMGQHDTGGDSLLGMLPGGKPVGLRGGEGILTPEAVQALGGKSGIDSLNSNPWSNPMKVATTAYGSFAKGVAKYSPWGKYLEASASGLEAMEKESERAEGEHRGRGHRGLPLEIEQMLDSGMSQQEVMQALGATKGKRGGFELPSGQYLSKEDRAMLGLPASSRSGERTPQGGTVGVPGSSNIGSGAERWRSLVEQITGQRGVSPAWVNPLLAQISTESSGNPRSINDHDSNGRGGTQTVEGLFNFLPSTFANSGGGDIFDPTQQINNAITYGLQKPGSNRQQPQGFGYGQGWAHGGVVGYGFGGIAGLPTAPAPPAPPPPPPAPRQGFDFGGAGTGGPGPGADPHGVVPRSGPPATDPTNTRQLPHIDPNAPGMQKPEAKPGQGAPPAPMAPKPGPDGEPAPKQIDMPDRNIKDNPSQPLTAEGKGFGVGGGLLGAAESGAAAMAGPLGAAAQPAFQLMNRAIGYGGQLVGIGIEGLMGTFLPNDSAAGDPSKNIFGKIALGIAGSHPSGNNMAGSSAEKLQPKQDLDQGAMQAKQVMPGIHINGDIHNHKDGQMEGLQSAVNQGINMHPSLIAHQ